MDEPERRPDDEVALRAVPAGLQGLLPRLLVGEPRPQDRHEQQVEEPVEDRGLPGLVPRDLLGQERHQRGVQRSRAEMDQLGQRGQEALADLATHLVAAHQHHRGAVRTVAPGPEPEIHGLAEILATRSDATHPGEHEDLRRFAGPVRRRCRSPAPARPRRRPGRARRAARRPSRTTPILRPRPPGPTAPRPSAGSTTVAPGWPAAGTRRGRADRREAAPAHPRHESRQARCWRASGRRPDLPLVRLRQGDGRPAHLRLRGPGEHRVVDSRLHPQQNESP